nr:endonuclease VII domain-containing protein [Actinacidiphila oryziradicis]
MPWHVTSPGGTAPRLTAGSALRSTPGSAGGTEGRTVRVNVVVPQAGHLYSGRKYGLPREELTALIRSRNSARSICPAAGAEHVDHDHETGRVRGVLCFSCDAALGQSKDRPDAIRRAADYVEGNVWKPTLVALGVYQLPS